LVDHRELLEALTFVKENMDWPLNILADDHESLLILRPNALLDPGYGVAVL